MSRFEPQTRPDVTAHTIRTGTGPSRDNVDLPDFPLGQLPVIAQKALRSGGPGIRTATEKPSGRARSTDDCQRC